MKLRTPPGRTGRLWLRDRLASARRAADLLDKKRSRLDRELRRMQTILKGRTDDWYRALHDAERWLGRSDAINGARTLTVAAALMRAPASARLTWRQSMGVRFPADADVRIPAAPDLAPMDGGASLAFVADAHARAVKAAVAHAVARTAVGRLEDELNRTVRRLRALQLRAIPAHETALHALELALDEQDREDAVNARWVADVAAGE